MLKITFFITILFMSISVSATCYHDGVAYPTGAVVGDYVCAANGTWVER